MRYGSPTFSYFATVFIASTDQVFHHPELYKETPLSESFCLSNHLDISQVSASLGVCLTSAFVCKKSLGNHKTRDQRLSEEFSFVVYCAAFIGVYAELCV